MCAPVQACVGTGTRGGNVRFNINHMVDGRMGMNGYDACAILVTRRSDVDVFHSFQRIRYTGRASRPNNSTQVNFDLYHSPRYERTSLRPLPMILICGILRNPLPVYKAAHSLRRPGAHVLPIRLYDMLRTMIYPARGLG